MTKNVVLVLSADVDTISQMERLMVCYKLKYRCYYCDERLWAFIDSEQNNLIVPLERMELHYGNVTYILEAITNSYCICRVYYKGNSDGYRFPKFYHEIYKHFAERMRHTNN